MDRPISDFALDEHGDWVARLGCGHRQHVRHKPPFQMRPWVTTPEGRSGKIGALLDCLRCDAAELPTDATAYRRTPDFTETTIPAGLLADHTTKAGVWGRIVVREGALRYVIPSLGRAEELRPDAVGIVIPEVPHHVAPIGSVRFHVEFLRSP